MSSRLTLAAAIITSAALFASPVNAQKSAPQPLPIVDAVPDPVDEPYDPGAMSLEVDATDTARGIFRVKQYIPVQMVEQLTLLYPKWLPGKHAPRGALAELAGLQFRDQAGALLKWSRDPVEVYAFHVEMPATTTLVVAEFEFTSPTRDSEGRIVVTPEMMNVQWEQVSLYPAGHFTRAIDIKPSIILPEGWTGVAALDGGVVSGNRIDYAKTTYETLIDSPLFAGKYYRKWGLGNKVTLNAFADEAKFLDAKPEQIAAHKALVDEAVALFGSKHFDRYEFLLALTEKMGGIGLEHHRSSENSRETDYFTEWADNGSERGLLPHEITHSWNGKFRRPDAMWTPDFATPMRDNLLWVYEGQTSYWDLVLAARSGLQTPEMVLGEWARQAGYYTEQAGREWRSVEDTTHDPIFAARKAKPFSSYARTEDYYNEGSLVWLDVDMTIRQLSNGKKSLDDFARSFFGLRDGDWGVLTYNFDDVVRELNKVQRYDWTAFLDARIRQPNQPPPLGGVEKGGYRLVWKDEPNVYDKERMKEGGHLDLTHSLGLVVEKDGKLSGILWNGAAFKAGLIGGAKLIAVNGIAYDKDRLKEAIKAKEPVTLLVQRDNRYDMVEIAYSGGLRYPHLEKAGMGPAGIDLLMLAKRK